MSPRRVFILAAVALLAYGGVAVWVLNQPDFEIPVIRGTAWAYLVAALVAYLGAMWFYGLLFRESIQQSGGQVKPWSAFKALLPTSSRWMQHCLLVTRVRSRRGSKESTIC